MLNLDEEQFLPQFLDSDVHYEFSDQDDDKKELDERPAKRACTEANRQDSKKDGTISNQDIRLNRLSSCTNNSVCKIGDGIVDSGTLNKIPLDLFYHILKFLSSEDLVSCSQVCKLLSNAASDESLWRRLYCMRWGLLPPTKKLWDCAWKKLYFQRDEEDIVKSVRNCQPEFKEYYIHMYSAKRSQVPLLSEVSDEHLNIDRTVADQVYIWKRDRGLSDKVVMDHACSGEVCSYFQIGNIFICEKTGNFHVCDDTCKEIVPDPENELLVCTISGRCFDRPLSVSETEEDAEQEENGVVTDEAEPFMGAGRFARAYLLGYNCTDEKELKATLWFC